MSKWYEVEMQVLIVLAVEVRDNQNERDAIEAADWNAPTIGRITSTANPLPAEHLATIKKHAHKVITLSGGDDDDDCEDDE